MKSILLFTFMLVTFVSSAQETLVTKYFESHSGLEGYTSIYITPYMFELFSKIAGQEGSNDFEEIASKLKSIKILSLDDELSQIQKDNFEQEISALAKSPQYKEMMIIKDGGQTVKFILNEQNERISEFLLLVYGGDDDPVLILLEGDLELKDIAKLSKSMNVKGFEHLENIDNQ